MQRFRSSAVIVLLLAHAVSGVAAQRSEPTFEVVSIKRNGNPRPTQIGFPPGSFVAIYTPLRPLIGLIYGADAETEVIGGPAWLDVEPFDIEAKAEGNPTQPIIKSMARALLEERFQLKVRREEREGPAWALVPVSSGDTHRGLRLATDRDCATDRQLVSPTLPMCGFRLPVIAEREVVLRGYYVTMDQIARNLKTFAGRPVVDRTGLTGRYSFELKAMRETSAASRGSIGDVGISATLLDDALREQLGLKLESARTSVDVIVIEAVQPPTPN